MFRNVLKVSHSLVQLNGKVLAPLKPLVGVRRVDGCVGCGHTSIDLGEHVFINVCGQRPFLHGFLHQTLQVHAVCQLDSHLHAGQDGRALLEVIDDLIVE
jgi:hypothetical protein